MSGTTRRLSRGLAAHWQLKVQLSLALTLFFCVPYFALQRFPLFEPVRLPLSATDQAVGFAPRWVWIYQSAYLLLSLVPWMVESADHLKRYARGFVWVSAVGFAFFLLLPIEGPRPHVVPDDVMFRALVAYDAPLNSFPSLHVGLSVYTVMFAAHAIGTRLSPPGRIAATVFLSTWSAAIAFAALATKQHYAVDLAAGALLAWACHHAVWRRSRQLTPQLKGAGMLKRSGLACAAILWTLSTAASAQQPPQAPDSREEADHESLRRLKPVYEQAIRENRVDLLREHLHSDFHGVMVTGRAVNSYPELEQYWRDIKALIGEGGTYTTTLKPERSVIVGDLALARGTTDDYVKTDAGDEYRFVTLWTATLQREGNAWKIRYVQGTMDPVGNPFVREFAQRAVVRTGAGAGAAGIIVGIAIGFLWQRRRARKT